MDVTRSEPVAGPQLERTSRRLAKPSVPFAVIATVLVVVGVVLLVVGSSWVWVLGIVLIALAGPPAMVALGLLCAAAVSRWTARRRPFA